MADKQTDLHDFEDEAFDESFDEAGYDEELVDDAEYAEDDLPDEDWQQEETAKKDKKRASGSKKPLSFNTIVIIGALVLGVAVLLFNIKTKTAEVNANKKTVFQSIIGIGEFMDGGLFGKDNQTPSATEATPTEQPAQQAEGFLNNPDTVAVVPSTQDPPIPAPITTPEVQPVQDPLTPMPEEAATPRGPDDVPAGPATSEEAPPAEPVAPSAKDILKQAIENHENKAQENKEALAEPAPPLPIETVKEEPAVAAAPIPPAKEPPVVAAAEKSSVALEEKIDTILKRMDRIESDLGSVRETKQASYDDMAKTIQDLKKELAAIKNRPAPAAPVQATVPEEAKAATSTTTPTKKKKKKTSTAQSRPVAQAVVWELRAAQPGRAWVSKPGSNDMQGVTVGQTLAGIGQITDIYYQDERWTVSGTQGQIRQ